MFYDEMALKENFDKIKSSLDGIDPISRLSIAATILDYALDELDLDWKDFIKIRNHVNEACPL